VPLQQALAGVVVAGRGGVQQFVGVRLVPLRRGYKVISPVARKRLQAFFAAGRAVAANVR
jgi:hypothetical protein